MSKTSASPIPFCSTGLSMLVSILSSSWGHYPSRTLKGQRIVNPPSVSRPPNADSILHRRKLRLNRSALCPAGVSRVVAQIVEALAASSSQYSPTLKEYAGTHVVTADTKHQILCFCHQDHCTGTSKIHISKRSPSKSVRSNDFSMSSNLVI